MSRYIKTYFRIEAGYEWGNGMSEKKMKIFYDEIHRLFLNAGWTIMCHNIGNTCDVINDKTKLYVHPQELSGPCEESLIPVVEKILSQGTSFRYKATDKYDILEDLTPEEIKTRYGQETEKIDKLILESFTTKKNNLFKNRLDVLFYVAGKIKIKTITDNLTVLTNCCAEYEAVSERYQKLLSQGKIIKHPTDPRNLSRTATARELEKNEKNYIPCLF